MTITTGNPTELLSPGLELDSYGPRFLEILIGLHDAKISLIPSSSAMYSLGITRQDCKGRGGLHLALHLRPFGFRPESGLKEHLVSPVLIRISNGGRHTIVRKPYGVRLAAKKLLAAEKDYRSSLRRSMLASGALLLLSRSAGPCSFPKSLHSAHVGDSRRPARTRNPIVKIRRAIKLQHLLTP